MNLTIPLMGLKPQPSATKAATLRSSSGLAKPQVNAVSSGEVAHHDAVSLRESAQVEVSCAADLSQPSSKPSVRDLGTARTPDSCRASRG